MCIGHRVIGFFCYTPANVSVPKIKRKIINFFAESYTETYRFRLHGRRQADTTSVVRKSVIFKRRFTRTTFLRTFATLQVLPLVHFPLLFNLAATWSHGIFRRKRCYVPVRFDGVYDWFHTCPNSNCAT